MLLPELLKIIQMYAVREIPVEVFQYERDNNVFEYLEEYRIEMPEPERIFYFQDKDDRSELVCQLPDARFAYFAFTRECFMPTGEEYATHLIFRTATDLEKLDVPKETWTKLLIPIDIEH